MARVISYSPVTPTIMTFGVQVASGGSKSPDGGYFERLVKYIPGETLAFFVPFAVLIGSGNPFLLWVLVVACVVGTPLYLWSNSRSLAAAKKPLPHYYVLSVVAFIVWALGVAPSFATLIGASDLGVTVTMGVTVFLLPKVDDVLAAWGI